MKIGRGVSELWRVENRPLPLTWPMAYTTACTTVHAVITARTLIIVHTHRVTVRRGEGFDDQCSSDTMIVNKKNTRLLTITNQNHISYAYLKSYSVGCDWNALVFSLFMVDSRYPVRCRRILPTIASTLLNPDGGHSDQRNAATTPSATDHSQ